MKRCPKCENKTLKHCKGSVKSCECNCTTYKDTTTNRVEPEYDSTHDEHYRKINEEWRALHPPIVEKEAPK